MKIERGEVEKMLAACEPGSDTFLRVTDELTRRKLAELCRTWLAVQDARSECADWLANTDAEYDNPSDAFARRVFCGSDS